MLYDKRQLRSLGTTNGTKRKKGEQAVFSANGSREKHTVHSRRMFQLLLLHIQLLKCLCLCRVDLKLTTPYAQMIDKHERLAGWGQRLARILKYCWIRPRIMLPNSLADEENAAIFFAFRTIAALVWRFHACCWLLLAIMLLLVTAIDTAAP